MQISFAYVFCFVTCKSVVSSSPDLGAYANPKIGMSKVMVVVAHSVIILPPLTCGLWPWRWEPWSAMEIAAADRNTRRNGIC